MFNNNDNDSRSLAELALECFESAVASCHGTTPVTAQNPRTCRNPDESVSVKAIKDYARRNGLETVFPPEHENFGILFYDPVEGRHYDREQDFFVELDELPIYDVKTKNPKAFRDWDYVLINRYTGEVVFKNQNLSPISAFLRNNFGIVTDKHMLPGTVYENFILRQQYQDTGEIFTVKDGKKVEFIDWPLSHRNPGDTDYDEDDTENPLKIKMLKALSEEFKPFSDYKDDAEVAIYYFAQDYHSGQNSDLYSILSTSPYSPGPFSTKESEGDTVQMMYESLEQNFGNKV